MQPCFEPFVNNGAYNLGIELDPYLMISDLCNRNSNWSNFVGFPVYSVSLGMVAQEGKGQIIEVAFIHQCHLEAVI